MKKTWVDRSKKTVEKDFFSFAKHLKVSPNTITILSMIATAVGFYFVVASQIILGLICFIIGGLLDLLDGAVAKTQHKATKFGSLLDKFADRVNDSLMILAPIFGSFVNAILGIVTLVLVLIGSYLSALLDSHTNNKQTGSSLSMRSIRTAILVFGGFAFLINEVCWGYAFFAVIAIALYSIIERLGYAFEHL